MKRKRFAIFGVLVALFFGGAWVLGGRVTVDHELTCTKCLEGHHVVKRKFLGVTYDTSDRLREAPEDYVTITGEQCVHVFRKGGSGRTTGFLGRRIMADGFTEEGVYFRERNQVIRDVFYLNRKLDAKDMANQTLALVEEWIPPDSDLVVLLRDPHAQDNRTKLTMFRIALEDVDSSEGWKMLLDAAEDDALDTYTTKTHNK